MASSNCSAPGIADTDDDELPDLPALDVPGMEGEAAMEGDGRPSQIRKDEQSSHKRRRIHLGMSECLQHQRSAEGALPLTNPAAVSKSSKDPHRGLYPRVPALPQQTQSSSGFVSARTLHQGPMANFLPSQTSSSPVKTVDASPRKKSPSKRKTQLSNQNNSMFDYFTKASKPSKSCSQTEPGCSQSSLDLALQSSSQGSSGCQATVTPPLPSLPTRFSSQVITIDSGSDCSNSSDAFDLIRKTKSAKQTKTRSKKSTNKKTKAKKKTPTFNRDNPFLYNNGPVSPTTSASVSRALSGGHDKYGLLGTGTEPDEEEEISDMSQLPEEVLELILCQLPLLDLILNVNRVCTRWNNIIAHKNFVPWKKRYMEVKLGRAGVQPGVMRLMATHGMATKVTCLPGLIRFMLTFKQRLPGNIDECLQRHCKYSWALALLKERLPDCITEGVPNPWSMICTLVIISETVSDIQEVMAGLMQSSSQCTALEIVECLYCVATFLLTFHLLYPRQVWNGMHYRLFYALYLFENSSSQTAAELSNAFQHVQHGQQSIMKYGDATKSVSLTHEQIQICKHNVQPGEVIKIVAFAGTGKTTTLVRYTQLRPNMRFLLVVYNKSVSEHAKSQFPSNVSVMTGHSLAHRAVGRRYAAAGKLNLGSLRVMDIIKNFKARKGESLYVQARLIIETLNAFLASTDDLPMLDHAPTKRLDRDKREHAVLMEMRQFYVAEATQIWRKMQDFKYYSLRITHDGYLKAYQLSHPVIEGYDVILIDEAQDLTPAIADVLLSQRQPKILVGDPHQQIYSFRGAINAMQQVQATHVYYLTQSFRFGPEIAFIAASILYFCKNERKKTLVGNGNPGGVSGQQQGQLAIITRCNYTLFAEAVKTCCYSDKPVKVAFVGGPESFGFDMILDIYALMLPEEQRGQEKRVIRHNLIKCFHSLGELEKFACEAMDKELLGKIRIVKTYNNALPAHISTIRQKCIRDRDLADVVFSTAHKSKGLEFSTVKLTDDFNAVPLAMADMVEETNILYVALTRAKRQLIMPKGLMHLMKMFGEHYLYPSPKQPAEKQHLVCSKKKRDFTPAALTLARKDFTLSDKGPCPGVLLCPQAVREELPAWLHLLGSETDEGSEHEDDEVMHGEENIDLFDDDLLGILML